MKIAVIGGTGKEGSGLALRWAHAGHEVIIGSRDPDKAKRAAEELNQTLGQVRVYGMDNLSAAQAAEVVVLSVPYAAHLETLQAMRPALSGKVLVDVTVPLNAQDITRVYVPPAGSAAKEAQVAVPEARVVAAFQNISATHLKKLDAVIECDVLVCADDEEARRVGMQLVQDAGMKAWDAGPLDNAVVVEGLTPILLGINKRHKVKGAGIRITGA
ncbi:MAG: NADPH-dependent F420 reductase [Thermoflexales bacterium]|nr:NADPH-dependent F420 reductase [Thermoflexales bacterium]MCS7325583.1 NADPH-dependent F420 reductase [Thermoflexales bacterium]MCX7940046.1 NADPH-dependent F420 reductase [Thermoflexales bacterium]MDW8053148.1 NADPH-dependent F420 reductase [Anaerolineae bacterium]MDW8291800.1 NADPH-dependent F420 reductase [Anaerolineae bacterium]